MTTEGPHEARTLTNGKELYLVRPPGKKWHIEKILGTEFKHAVAVNVLETTEVQLPKGWKDLEFDSADDAVSFVEREIAHL